MKYTKIVSLLLFLLLLLVRLNSWTLRSPSEYQTRLLQCSMSLLKTKMFFSSILFLSLHNYQTFCTKPYTITIWAKEIKFSNFKCYLKSATFSNEFFLSPFHLLFFQLTLFFKFYGFQKSHFMSVVLAKNERYVVLADSVFRVL